jgi:hypothetical protein
MHLIKVVPLDLGGPTLLSLAHIEGARPELRDGKEGFLLYTAGRAVGWITARAMTRLRAGQPVGDSECSK